MTDAKRLVCAALSIAALCWVVLLATGPWVASAAASLGGSLYAIGALICHQQPDRSFHLGAAQLPVCARCLGLYAGGAAGLVLWTLAGSRRAVSWPARRAVLLLLVSGVPTAVTVLTATLGVADPSNAWRAWLAAPLGVMSGLVGGAVVTDHLK